MKGYISGREAIGDLDAQLGRLRQSLADALAAADAVETRRASIHSGQAAAYAALATFRLDIMQSKDGAAKFGEIEAAARRLVLAHETFVAEQEHALEAAAADIARLEAVRAETAAAHDSAVSAYEKRVADVESSLRGDPDYSRLVAAAEEAQAVRLRAEQKLELARADRIEKGAPYDTDPLFAYLWKRQFRSPAYKAGPLIRFLDAWVASLCKYDQAFLNYQRLTELPERIADHVAYVAGLEEAAEASLVAAEEAAMLAAGTADLKSKADALKAEIAACDEAISAAEIRHRETAERHERALRDEAGPAVEARALLETALRGASFPDLRVLAAETTTLEDDRLVDTLVRLRAEEMSLDIEAPRTAARPSTLRENLARMENLRSQFKAARFDSPYALFSKAGFDDVIAGLARGETDLRGALNALSRMVRRASPQAHPDFGGDRRRETIGLPDVLGGVIGGVLGEVLEEVIEEIGRHDGGGQRGSGPIFPGGSSRPSRPRSGGRSKPRPGGARKGGGFRTGGGF